MSKQSARCSLSGCAAALVISLLLIALIVVGPGSARSVEAEVKVSLAPANNAFAVDLFHALRGGDGNLFFSPYSVSSALLMTAEGARGETASEMRSVLHVSELPSASLSSLYANLRATLLKAPTYQEGHRRDVRERPAYELSIANALWGQKGFGFEAPFLNTLAERYRAPLERIDFKETEAARLRINGWVEEQTRKKIRDIVPPGVLSADSRLVLANAIYFKAPWLDPFKARWTKDATFTGPDGAESQASFMHRKARFRYGEIAGAKALEIPLQKGATSMLVILPKTKDGLPALEQKLKAEDLAGFRRGSENKLVDLHLPKFKFTVATNLTATLPRMGMASAFDAKQADFSGMTTKEKLVIGAVLHKAFVAVDEGGVEAAAATVVMMKLGAAAPSADPTVFRADHPFLFIIRHEATGAILFMGRVSKPMP